MVLAVSTFTCLDTVSKYLSQHYPVPAVVWVRYLVHVLLMAALLGPRMGLGLVRTANPRLQVVRGTLLAAASLVFVTGLSLLPLAEAASIAFTAPLFVAVLAGPLLKEEVGVRTWAALAGGFVGVLLIVRPGSGLFSWAALLPLASAAMMALYQMMTRRLAGRDSTLTLLFIPALVGSVLVPLVFPHQLALPQGWGHAGLFLLIGILGALGHYLLILAHHHAPASVLSPFMYAQLFTALALGWLVFGQLPDAVALAGMAAICASGLVLVLGQRRY